MNRFWKPNRDFEPLIRTQGGAKAPSLPENEPLAKKPKIPGTVAAQLGDAVQTVEAFAADDVDFIKVYQNARRFEKKNMPDNSNNDNSTNQDTTWETCDYVELYWDTPEEKQPGKLKKVTGVHKIHWPNWNWEESDASALDSSRMLSTPVTEESSHDHNKIEPEVARIVKEHMDSGYVEVDKFLEYHKVHLPCFTWIVSESEIPSQPVNSSQIGGNPALYKGENWPEDGMFAFQINLETLPKRMQCFMGQTGLLQLFVSIDGLFDDGKFRIIPKEDFPKLERSTITDNNTTSSSSSDEQPVKPRLITGWVERPDYPTDYDCDSDVFDKAMESKSEELSISYDKFGGYGRYCQDGNQGPGYIACRNCGKPHLYRRETFNMVHEGLLRLGLGDMGTAQIGYCPLEPEKTLTMESSCY